MLTLVVYSGPVDIFVCYSSAGDCFGREVAPATRRVCRCAQHCSLAIPHLWCFIREVHQTLNQRISFSTLCTLAVWTLVCMLVPSPRCAGLALLGVPEREWVVRESEGQWSCGKNNLHQGKVNGIAVDVWNSNYNWAKLYTCILLEGISWHTRHCCPCRGGGIYGCNTWQSDIWWEGLVQSVTLAGHQSLPGNLSLTLFLWWPKPWK